MKRNLTQKRLKEVLHYNPKTGVFVRKKTISKKIKVGDVAGTITDQGYRKIKVDGELYKASRLAWLYMEGYFPENSVDHINRIRDDDRWKNLRHVSHQCNIRNAKVCVKNKSGVTGVLAYYKKWAVYIGVDGKCVYLGAFKSKSDAVKVRWKAEVEHGYPNCNTTSTAFLYLQSIGALD